MATNPERSSTAGAPDPVRRLLSKLESYRLAASHGIATPEVYGVWEHPAAVDWAALPERFVLKTDRGAASRGVLPIRRDGTAITVAGTDAPWSPQDVVERLEGLRTAGRAHFPVFAEEWLEPDDPGLTMPIDVKAYTFFGEVGMILLRRPTAHRHGAPALVRYLTPSGADLGDISPERHVTDEVPTPRDLPRLVAAAATLSAATRTPFMRVDLYETTRGVVFGEFTPVPGGRQHFTGGVDRRLGEMWEDAEHRLAPLVHASGALDLRYGSA